MTEKQFETKIKSFLKSEGCYFIKYWGGGMFTKSGVPDLLICCNGKFLGIELKTEKGVVSELQDYHLTQIGDSGGIGLVIRPTDFDNFKQLIRRLKCEN